MTDPRDAIESTVSPIDSGMLRCALADAGRAIATIALVCCTFTTVASVLLIAYTRANPAFDFIQLPGGLILRALFFGVLTILAGALLWRLREDRSATAAGTEARPARGEASVLIALLLAIAMLLGARVEHYPWAAPDEVHHLVVAKNLAVHGSYASGHPVRGLKYFDSFDSVGPAVLGPVATAFIAFGVDLGHARLVMVAFFIGLCVATSLFSRGVFGRWTGVAAVALLAGTYSSSYLGRTLYGEVPAYMFLLFGLLAWRRALGGNAAVISWGLLAGALVACAVLSKTIIVLVAFSFLGAWVYDRVTHRAIRLAHVVFPCAGALAVLGAWALFQRMHGAGQPEDGGVLAIYQHYLLFGVSSFAQGFRHAVMPHPIAHLAWLGVIVATIPLLFRRGHDPAAITLYLYAVFLLYWWFFFTPGQLHRYLWNAYAIFSLFSAPWVARALSMLFRRAGGMGVRALGLMLLLGLAAPGVQWIGLQAREILTKDEMAPEHALLEAVAALPATARIGTDIGRVPGLVNFLGNYAVESGADPVALLDTCDAVITRDSPELRAGLPLDCRVKPAGAFVLLSSGPLRHSNAGGERSSGPNAALRSVENTRISAVSRLDFGP